MTNTGPNMVVLPALGAPEANVMAPLPGGSTATPPLPVLVTGRAMKEPLPMFRCILAARLRRREWT